MCRATVIWDGCRGEWGVRRVAKGISGWVLGDSGLYLSPLNNYSVSMAYLPSPVYPFGQLSRVSLCSSNLSC